MHMLQRILNIIDPRIRHTTPLQQIQPFLRRLLLRQFLNVRLELLPVFDAHIVRDEAVIGRPFGLTELLAQNAEEPVVAAAYQQVAVGGLEAAVGYDGCWISVSATHKRTISS